MKAHRVLWLGWMLSALMPAERSPAAEPPAKPRYRIEYSTYLGGAEFDQAREIIVDPDGSVLVGMQTNSSDMPTTPGAFQRRYAGDDPALGHGGWSRSFPAT